MLASSVERLMQQLAPGDLVLDVGGWARPLTRANWVLDLMPYETRGQYGHDGPDDEHFSADTWVEWDICARTPFPFDDDQFDFVVCSHTLEDVRDPVWVCSEIARVGKAGYVEAPSRLEEQCYGVQGPWVGWSHHRWLLESDGSSLSFVFKPHLLSGRPETTFPAGFDAQYTDEERVEMLWWEGSFGFAERIFYDYVEFDSYLADFVQQNMEARRPARPPERDRSRLRTRAQRGLAWGRRRTGA